MTNFYNQQLDTVHNAVQQQINEYKKENVVKETWSPKKLKQASIILMSKN